MAIVLGLPKTRGNSEVIESKEFSAAIPAGQPVIIGADNKLAPYAGTGVVAGVGGRTNLGKTTELIRSGLEVGVKIASAETPVIGAQVYVTSTGLFSAVSTDNTAVNATFRSGVDAEAIDPTTGKTVSGVGAVYIDFVGGL
jgi:hypothetical protein